MTTNDHQRELAERFKRDTANHTMTVLHDDGLYRHLRFTKPDSSMYWFEIVTWPGSLAIRGDVDGNLVFSRLPDMFQFFRSDHGINPGYWAEKTADHGKSLKEYSEAVFLQHVTDLLAEFAEEDPALAQTVKAEITDAVARGEAGFEEEARELARFWEDKGVFSDTWEWDLTDWKWSYLWCCHAIVAGIAQYDTARNRPSWIRRVLNRLTQVRVSRPAKVVTVELDGVSA
ncbi:hypothetical protein OG992_18815 [Micromonospora sp. NBC_00362]|uniref:hypothetical protein n=1 Tax=Micromonospora sp. NBC_00362 TaxID=2975975 RepID=UPI0022520DCE|nr:hypothetical protein [Micromonospora sp. NBC_00362]MCX5119242.1 hypothetical protein [Micromonospora sp. NBC_00362]